jgi:hypothetical protein
MKAFVLLFQLPILRAFAFSHKGSSKTISVENDCKIFGKIGDIKFLITLFPQENLCLVVPPLIIFS